jgi:predicted N-acyltransferase
MRLRVLDGVREAPRAAWNALVAEGSPFLEWDFLAALEESGVAGEDAGWRSQPLTLWDGDRLLGACPLYVKGHSLGEFVFDQGWATAAARAGIPYYPKLLVAVPFTPVTGTRFLAVPEARHAVVEALAAGLEELAERHDLSSVHVNFCLADEVEVLAGRGWLRRTGFQYHWANEGFVTFEDYLGSLRSKRRNQVRRERRALSAQGVEIEALVGAEIPESLLARMFEFYQRTVDDHTWGQRHLNARFFALMGDRFRHRLCLVVARRAGEVIAATFNVHKGDALYGRYWGATMPLRHLHFNVCYYAAVEHCIAAGIARFEPGAGGEFKQLRGFEPQPTESMHLVRDPRLQNAVRTFLADERRLVAREMGWLDERTALKRERP